MYTIHLHNLKFHSFHGLHEEESIIGSEYEVTVDMETAISNVDSIADTIDYSVIFDIIKTAMKNPVDLLETLAEEICLSIHQHFALVKAIRITIFKCDAPLSAIQGKVGVTLLKHF